jgi:hypothetical protein
VTGRTRRCLNLGSYNYLGFAAADEYCTPRVLDTLADWGMSTCSARTEGGACGFWIFSVFVLYYAGWRMEDSPVWQAGEVGGGGVGGWGGGEFGGLSLMSAVHTERGGSRPWLTLAGHPAFSTGDRGLSRGCAAGIVAAVQAAHSSDKQSGTPFCTSVRLHRW